MGGKAVSLSILAACSVAAMALWFSATAVVPSLRAEYALSPGHAALLTSSVQIGFVAGTLISAILGLADRFDPRRFFMISALIATAANGAILLFVPTAPVVIGLRFVTGMCMAGIYPVGMKIVTTWAEHDMGLIVGVLIGALALGSASPHLLNALGGVDWRFAIAAASAASLAAALMINLVALGPKLAAPTRIDPRLVLTAWSSPPLRLANLGYLGHMWELFAMWAWLGVFLDSSFRATLGDVEGPFWARAATFAAMGLGGALGCVGGGLLADRFGRTLVTMAAMAASGSCALVVGFLFAADPVWLFALCFVWGVVVVADSAQFSASVAELTEPSRVGTMLTVQTCAGFLLTLATIHLMPALVAAAGWGVAFATLAVGPYLGVWAMARLRARPEAARLAHGRR
ncbi:MAG: MFS transporter [Alphaproteobacteria bacterium]|nr:MFS transporter [Alphaproteobacteria bacterium]